MGSRYQVGTVPVGSRKILLDQAHALKRDSLGQRVIMGGGECLDAMRERVEPGAGGNESGHADRQFRIADDHRRQDLRMKDNFFHVRFGIDDHRRPTDFRTSTSGCGNRDNRRDDIGVGARPPVANVFKIPYWTRLSCHERHHLAQVHT